MQDQNFRDFSLFTVDHKHRNCPSTRCALGANACNNDIGVLGGCLITVNIIGLISDIFTT
jgi:hypothetical protein